MALYKREKKGTPDWASKPWWMGFTSPNGTRVRQSTGTSDKQHALQVETRLKDELFREQKLGDKGGSLFSDAVQRLLREKRGKKVAVEYERQLAWWQAQFEIALKTRAVKLKQVDKALILKVIALKQAEATDATANRYLSALRVCLRLMHKKYDLVAEVPAFFMNQEPKGRVRWLTQDEIQRLLAALPGHLRGMAVVALSTGLRRSVVEMMTWDQIDLERRTITVLDTAMKNGEHHVVPIPDLAEEIIRQQMGKHDKHVWTYKGRPFKRCSTATWERAKAKAGIEDFRWHDLRHTWATMLAQGGTPDGILMVLGAWKSMAMVRKYAHHNLESVRPAVALLDIRMKDFRPV